MPRTRRIFSKQQAAAAPFLLVLLLFLLFAVSGVPAISAWTFPSSFLRPATKAPTGTTVLMSSGAGRDDDDDGIRVLGVCGGIGSGKSTACKLLVDKLRCRSRIDADTVAHSVYEPGSKAVSEIAEAFEFGGTSKSKSKSRSVLEIDDATGEPVRPLTVDRKKLGSIVFADRSEMARLEAIVWPHVREKLEERLGELRSRKAAAVGDGETPVIVLEAAVLLDAGWDDLLDGVWAVTASRETALRRLVETRGLSEAEAAKRIDAQASRRGMSAAGLDAERTAGTVQTVVHNDGSLADLEGSLRRALDDPACWRNPPPPASSAAASSSVVDPTTTTPGEQ
mmetsp:Transcript_9237/g.22686  ORF Transcript_9237/g.22686 Transcript_9237/m.22686 type:complete len:338 (+) Transcript_9237:104-1117(+)